MIFQVGLLTKAPVANVALERPCSSVHVCMRFEITWCGEGFAAHGTFMWFFLKRPKKWDMRILMWNTSLMITSSHGSNVRIFLPLRFYVKSIQEWIWSLKHCHICYFSFTKRCQKGHFATSTTIKVISPKILTVTKEM